MDGDNLTSGSQGLQLLKPKIRALSIVDLSTIFLTCCCHKDVEKSSKRMWIQILAKLISTNHDQAHSYRDELVALENNLLNYSLQGGTVTITNFEGCSNESINELIYNIECCAIPAVGQGVPMSRLTEENIKHKRVRSGLIYVTRKFAEKCIVDNATEKSDFIQNLGCFEPALVLMSRSFRATFFGGFDFICFNSNGINKVCKLPTEAGMPS